MWRLLGGSLIFEAGEEAGESFDVWVCRYMDEEIWEFGKDHINVLLASRISGMSISCFEGRKSSIAYGTREPQPEGLHVTRE